MRISRIDIDQNLNWTFNAAKQTFVENIFCEIMFELECNQIVIWARTCNTPTQRVKIQEDFIAKNP